MSDDLRMCPDLSNESLHTLPGDSTPALNDLNVRRYLASLEQSLDQSTRWAAFEPDGDALWTRVRATIRDFLTSEWQAGKLKGASAEQAFFVRCDQATMTQDDLDNGRLNVVIGVAPVTPAEFVIINIAQWTAGHRP